MTAGSGLLQDPAFKEEVPLPQLPAEALDAAAQAQWPPMLELEPEVEERLNFWIEEEIRRAWTEREGLLEDWTNWQKQYWATPASKEKNFPFRRAANIVVPLTAIAVEAVHARIMNTLFTVEPFWSVRPQAKAWINTAPFFEEFLQTEAMNPTGLDVYKFSNHSMMELIKLGTCIGKSGYERITKKALDPRSDGTIEDRFVEVRNSATLEYVPLANFLIRIGEFDPQTSPWCGEEHVFTWAQLKNLAANKRIMASKLIKIKDFWTSSEAGRTAGDAQTLKDEVDKLSNQEPIWNEDFKTQEIWATFDIDGDGFDEEIVVDYHYESRTILSIRSNWYSDLHRPYRSAVYVTVEGRFYGIGVGKQNEQFQSEVTTIHRQRLDNATLANMRMLVLKKTTGYGPKEPIFPGKMWFADDPKDIQVLQLSEVYNSAFANEDVLVRYSEKRTGVNEVLLGLPQQGTPGTATGDLARIAEGNKRFDLVLRNIRRFLSLLGQDVAANYQQFGDQQRHWLMLGEDGVFVEQVLNMPPQLVRDGALIELTASSSIVNRQVEQQNWISLFTVISSYYDRIIQLGQLFGDETLALVARRAVIASDEAARRLFDTFGIVETERLLLLGGPESGQTSITTGDPGRANGGPEGGSQGSGQIPSVEQLVAGIQQRREAEAEAGGAGQQPPRRLG